MSNEDVPPPMFDGDDFPYWKIRMESYLEASDTKCLKAMTEGFTPLAKDTALTPQEQENEKWNAKAKNHIFRGLCKEVFNRVRNHKTAHELWKELCALHEGSKSEREERFHLVMNKLNTFEMLPKENANEMYSHLNVIVEELNGLGIKQMSNHASSRRSLHRHTNIQIGEDQRS